ncbi:MAG: sporulation transcriptional regulator SpoIIID [Ruminococcaceae bacterium]|nr:sporulation transcriptional regulator SpoIIID [Oscillospiraceae bacterium]
MGDCVTARKTSFGDIRDERAVRIADYIVLSGATVRDAAKVFGVSKSTVHKDVTSRLCECDRDLFEKVNRVLSKNKAERHLRGGEATKEKYLKNK